MSRASAMAFRLFCFVALVLLLSPPALTFPVTDISCGSIVKNLGPCLGYIKGKDTNPDKECCNGVKAVVDSIKSKTDRQNVCECVKSAMSKIKYDPDRVAALSDKCRLSTRLPPVTPKTDCKKLLF